jgi:hypothetical protein
MPRQPHQRRSRGGRRTAAAALCTLATLTTGVLLAPSAQAAGSNWEAWSGNCYGWTTWDANHVTGHTWDHAYDDCRISIIQWNAYETPGSGSSYRNADAYAPNTGADTPTWWHGPTDTGGLLEVQVCVQDMSTGAETQCSHVYN